MSYIKVEGHDNLVRDASTGAIINTDKSVLIESRKYNNGSSSIKQLQCEVEVLKNELLDIKNLLRELISNAS